MSMCDGHSFADLMTDPVSGAASATIPVGDLDFVGISDGYLIVQPEMLGSPEEPTGGYDALAEFYQPVSMPIGCFLLRGEQNILIDTGYGPESEPISDLMVGGRLLGELERIGLTPNDIDVIAISHLHIDHAGTLGDRVSGEPIFPRAQVFVGEADWQYFIVDREGIMPAAEFLHTALTTMKSQGQIELMTGDVDITSALRRIDAPGHTPGHSLFEVHDQDERVLLLGDAMYCAQQLGKLDWSVAFDENPALARTTRERLTRDLEANGGRALGCHFPELKLASA